MKKVAHMLSGLGLMLAGIFFPAWWALVAVGFLAAIQSALFAHAESGSVLRVIESATAHPLELGALTDKLGANNLMPMYVPRGGRYEPVVSAFIARLNSQHAIVLGVS